MLFSHDTAQIMLLFYYYMRFTRSFEITCRDSNKLFGIGHMRGSRNFHERGSNENGNFWSQTRGGPTPQKFPNYLFLGKIFKFEGGGVRTPGPPPLDPRMGHWQ